MGIEAQDLSKSPRDRITPYYPPTNQHQHPSRVLHRLRRFIEGRQRRASSLYQDAVVVAEVLACA